MDELRKRIASAILVATEARCADDGDGYVDAWVGGTDEAAYRVLDEIAKTHQLVPLVDTRRDGYGHIVVQPAPGKVLYKP